MTSFTPAQRNSEQQAATTPWESADPALLVHVVATDSDATTAALREASKFARFAEVPVSLDVFHVVPYPLPLDQPHVDIACLRSRYMQLVVSSGVAAFVHVHFCRSRAEAMKTCFEPPSVVYLGCRARRWWCEPKRLARALRKAGHNVQLVSLKVRQ